ncbi:MAG: hypothetical protein IEMM0002_0814 [bacterium]|nr:MAG: hypothetical protein IEMM0002_0814 [bacterium]
MRLTREKINQLSKVILKGFLEDDRVEYFCEANDLRLEVVKVLTDELKKEDEIETAVRKTIGSYGRDLREGTDEWDIVYQRHYQEELKKRRGIDL